MYAGWPNAAREALRAAGNIQLLLPLRHSILSSRRFAGPTVATITSRTSSAMMPPVVGTCPAASRLQHPSAKATRTSSHVAADLQRVGAPAGAAPVNGDPAIVAPLLALVAIALEEQALDVHHMVSLLWIGRRAPGLPGLTAQRRMDTAIATMNMVKWDDDRSE